jgi:hypothetical protein
MSETTKPEAAATPGPLAGIAITGIVIVLLVAWFAIWLGVLKKGEGTLVGAFLFLWYWANNEQLQVNRLVPAMLGALVGIGIAWLLWYAPQTYGGAGLAAGLGALILALYLDVTKTLAIAVNASTMLFLTLAAAPLVQKVVDWPELVLSTVLGGLFFAGAVYGLQKLAAKFASTPA